MTNIITHWEDCIKGMEKLPDRSVDLIIADPDFGLSVPKSIYARDPSFVAKGYKQAPEDYRLFTLDWMNQCIRVLKDTGSLYVFSGHSCLLDILLIAKLLKLKLQNQIIWKYQFGNAAVKYAFVTSHYNLLLFTKADRGYYYFNKPQAETKEERKARYADMEDVWVINREYQPKKMKNVNKLPVALIQKIMRYSLPPKGTVLDPFLGNGTTHQAAVLQGAGESIGFEINPNMKPIVEENIRLTCINQS